MIKEACLGVRGGAGGRGVLISFIAVVIAVVVCPLTFASLHGRDGARWVFTDQADIACTKRKAP